MNYKKAKKYVIGCMKEMLGPGFKTIQRNVISSLNNYILTFWNGYFMVAVCFKEDNRTELLKADVSEEAKQLIRKGKMFSPKIRRFPVEFQITTVEQCADIYTILKYKIRLEAN